jgi:YHS domain-containing protein
MATKILKQIHNTNQNFNYTHKIQRHIAKNIQQKITKNNAIITQADKGKTTVIIYKQDYQGKVHAFLSDNNFHTLPSNPTKKYQTHMAKTLQQCNFILHEKQIRHLTQKPPPTYTKSPTQIPQTRHPHKAGSQQQKCPFIQNGQETQRHLKTTPTPEQSLHGRHINQPGSKPDQTHNQ